MDNTEIQHLIKVAKILKKRRDERRITVFEEAELKEIYKLLLFVNNK